MLTGKNKLKLSTSSQSNDANETDSIDNLSVDKQSESKDGSQPSVAEICSGMFSSDVNKQLESILGTNSILLMKIDEPLETFIDELITADIVQKIVSFLSVPELQFESGWALMNIVSGNTAHTKVVADAGAVPHFVTLLTSESPKLTDQAVCVLGNIAGDGPAMRDLIIESGAVEPLLNLAR